MQDIIASQLIRYCERLIIGQGRLAGQRMKLFGWQKRFIRGAFGIDGDAGLTLARGGGKTTFTAALAAATLDGPLLEPMAETVIVASSFEQGLIAFRHIQHFMGDQLADKARWRIQDSANRASIENRKTGSRLRVIGSDPRRAHGLAPKLMLLDEVAQWPHTTIDRMLAALETSKGKIPGSRALWLGTRAATPDHPFERALAGGLEYPQIHAARPDDPPFQRRTWRRANPGLDELPDLEIAIRREAARAKRDPAALAHFRALRLNMGVSDSVESVVLDAGVWEGIEVDAADRRGRYVLGIDLGQTAAMSAVAGYWPDTGTLDAFGVFPREPALQVRGLRDGVDRLYVRMAERGELIQAGQKVSDVPALLLEVQERWGNPGAITCDAWRQGELIESLQACGFPTCPLITRRHGFYDGNVDLRAFRAACLDGRVRPVRSLLLRSAMSGARTVGDAAGNVKLSKGGQGRRTRARDDAVAASILAVAEGRRLTARAAAKPDFQYAIV